MATFIAHLFCAENGLRMMSFGVGYTALAKCGTRTHNVDVQRTMADKSQLCVNRPIIRQQWIFWMCARKLSFTFRMRILKFTKYCGHFWTWHVDGVCVFAASLTRMSRCSNQFIGRHKRRTLLASHRRRLANKWNGSRLPNEKKKHMRDHGTSSNRTTTKQILYPFICNSISIIITLLNIEIYDHYGEPAVSGSSKTQDKEKTKKKNKSTIIIIGVTMAI